MQFRGSSGEPPRDLGKSSSITVESGSGYLRDGCSGWPQMAQWVEFALIRFTSSRLRCPFALVEVVIIAPAPVSGTRELVEFSGTMTQPRCRVDRGAFRACEPVDVSERHPFELIEFKGFSEGETILLAGAEDQGDWQRCSPPPVNGDAPSRGFYETIPPSLGRNPEHQTQLG